MTDAITTASGLAASPEPTAQSRFSEDYDTFLQLLTAQLQNQNPTEPMNTNEFTQQIVSYSSLEQQINTNTQLEDLVSMMEGFLSNNAISYVGDIVTFGGAATELENGSASWTYDLSRTGVDGKIEIRDSSGLIVKTDQAAISAGRHEYVWDGRRDDGTLATDGTYSISVDVRDSDDVAVGVSTSISGKVEAVDVTGSQPQLIVDGRTIDISEVMTVRSAT